MTGRDPDQFDYTGPMLGVLLELALDGPQMPAAGLTGMPRSTGDPAEGGNLLAMLVDVRRAVGMLPRHERAQLYADHLAGREHSGYLVRELAARLNGAPAAGPPPSPHLVGMRRGLISDQGTGGRLPGP